MKRVFVMFLFGAFIFTGVGFAQTPPAAPASTPAVVKPSAVHHERHAEIHRAIRKLRGAKEDLEKAGRDYSGHRAKAVEAINQAIRELNEALETVKGETVKGAKE